MGEMTRWYRAYEGTVSDPKLAEAALVVGCSKSVAVATWHALLENGASLNDGGRVDTPARRIAAVLSEPVEVIQALFNSFCEAGMLEGSNIVSWKKRQFESDSSTERSRKSREAAREREATGAQQQSNADATLQNENETSPSVYVSDSVSHETTLSEKVTDDFENWYAVFPKHVGRGAALRAYRGARKKADPLVLLAGARQAAAQYAQSDPKFIPHPATWLNGERWLDQASPEASNPDDWRTGAH